MTCVLARTSFGTIERWGHDYVVLSAARVVVERCVSLGEAMRVLSTWKGW